MTSLTLIPPLVSKGTSVKYRPRHLILIPTTVKRTSPSTVRRMYNHFCDLIILRFAWLHQVVTVFKVCFKHTYKEVLFKKIDEPISANIERCIRYTNFQNNKLSVRLLRWRATEIANKTFRYILNKHSISSSCGLLSSIINLDCTKKEERINKSEKD